MSKLFFFEIPLSLLIAQLGAFSSYIVTIGLWSTFGLNTTFSAWVLAALILVATLFIFKRASFFEKRVLFKNAVFVYSPFAACITGLVFIMKGIYQ